MNYSFFFIPTILLFSLAGCKTGINTENPRLSALEKKIQHYYQEKHRDSMIMVANELLPLLKADSFAVRRGHVLVQKGIAFDILGQYDSASYCLYEALHLGETEKNPELLARALNNIGILYFNLGKSSEAITAYERWLGMTKQQNDSVGIARALNNIGNAYMTIDKNTKKAIPYFQECITISNAINFNQAWFTASINLAQCLILNDRLEEAQATIDKVNKTGGNDYYADYTQALIHRKAKKYDKAIAIMEKIMGLKVNTRELYLALMNELAQLYEEKGDLDRALDYRKQYQTKRDSLHTLERENIIQELKISYETEKKELHIVTLNEERKLYLILTVIGGIGIFLLFIILILINRYQKLKRIRIEEQVKKLEQEKQLVAASSLLDGENHERGRLSRELHDGLGGLLTMVRLDLAQIKTNMSQESQKLDKAILLMDKSITEMRRLAHNLMPESLARFGLKPVLEEYCKGSDMVNFHFYGEELRYNEKTEINFYRIAGELINNALKHANATEINVQLILSESKLSLTVSDNGVGIASPKSKEELMTVRSRVELLGATMNIYTLPQKGTEITIELCKESKN